MFVMKALPTSDKVITVTKNDGTIILLLDGTKMEDWFES